MSMKTHQSTINSINPYMTVACLRSCITPVKCILFSVSVPPYTEVHTEYGERIKIQNTKQKNPTDFVTLYKWIT